MRARLLIPLAATVAVAAAPSPASAGAVKKCPVKDGLFTQFQVHRGPAKSVTCASAFRVLYTGVLEHRAPSGWRCRAPNLKRWPLVVSCERRSRGRRTATAELYAADDFYPG